MSIGGATFLSAVTGNEASDSNPVDLFKMQYGHDAVGNRMYSRNNVLTDRSERYGYDNLNRLTVMDRGVLSLDGTMVDPALDHPVLNSSQQWADLDRRGNWLDYRWAESIGGEPVVHQQTREANGVNEYPSIDPDGPLTPTPEPVPPVSLTYDAAGNLTVNPLVCNPGDVCEPGMPCGMGSPICGSGQRYVYDQENRLTVVYGANSTPEVTTDDMLLAQYEYDALGRRVSSIEYVNAETGALLTPPKRTRHVYVGIETIEEYDVEVATEWPYAETATLAREFLWGDPGSFPEPVAMVTHGGASGGQGGIGVPAGESVYHYFHDALGSVVGLTDSTGALVERYTYDPYGRTYVERPHGQGGWTGGGVSTFGNPWMWTGQRHDALTGLYAFHFRMHSPSLGRWLQRDPIGYLSGVNLYQYLMGNPLGQVDPLGLWSKEAHDKIIDCLAQINGWPAWYVEILKKASAALDHYKNWTKPEETKKHSLRNPEQTPEEARKERDDWIEDQMENAERLIAEYLETGDESKLEQAITIHGEIIHALSDETAPGHGFAQWPPEASGGWELVGGMLEHGAGEGLEALTDEKLKETVEKIREW